MPIHDWERVDAGIFHDFHQAWIQEIKRALNRGLLPPDHYALTEQHGGGFQPDILALKTSLPDSTPGEQTPPEAGNGGVMVAEPQVRIRAETEANFYRRKQSVVAVRHASGDKLVAVVEIVSKANKAGRSAFEFFLKKAYEFLNHDIHLLILDLQPPTSRDLQGIHGAIWEMITDDPYERPADKPLTLASYEASMGIRAFVEPVAVSDTLIDMPLFLMQDRYVPVPLEKTYTEAFDAVPRRWKEVLELNSGDPN